MGGNIVSTSARMKESAPGGDTACVDPRQAVHVCV